MLTGKLFMNSRSQAVRLPKSCRMPGKEVIITHLGNAIVLQPKTESWLDVYRAMPAASADFLDERDDSLPQEREDLD